MIVNRHPQILFRLSLTLFAFSASAAAATPGQIEFFEKKIRPILAEKCYTCHSKDAETPFAGLLLDTREGVLKGGDHGPAVVPGSPDESHLIQAVRHETIQMPPTGKLAPDEIAALEKWVRIGVPWPEEHSQAASTGAADPETQERRQQHWAWQPVRSVRPPRVKDDAWPRTAIDRFVLARLEEKGLQPSPPADRRTVLRRLSYDLVGLPPTPEEIDAFENDSSRWAVEKAVGRLLQSPHFGERWGRYWLDLARYSDTGAQNRPFPFPWSYRDWVIQAINDDMPYDRFVLLQLAADQLDLENKANLAALGFLTVGINLPRPTDVPENLDDRIDVVTRTFLALTVSCARCHDHKYDPIPQRDYYSLYGVFLNSPDRLEPIPVEPVAKAPLTGFYRDRLQVRRRAIDDFRRERLEAHKAEFRSAEWIERYLVGAWLGRDATNPQLENMARERNLNLYLLKRWRAYLIDAIEKGDPVFALWGESPAGLAQANPNVAAEFEDSPAESVEDLARRYAKLLAEVSRPEPFDDPAKEALRKVLWGKGAPANVPFEDFWWIQTEGDSNVVKNLKWQYHGVLSDWGYRGGPRHAMLVEDAAKIEPAYVFVRGNQHDLGEQVPRRFLSILTGPGAEPFQHGSGRLELARAIASPDNPLTARVMVNRVWQRLFGEGIVRTPSDFGLRGAPPTHPDLLDYLAREFVKNGWSVKTLIRQIVLSSTYQQSSQDNPAALKIDSENKLLWRMNRRRLDFEALRDSLLYLAGRLEPSVGGSSFSLGAVPAAPRRTIYAYIEREQMAGLLRSFDFSNPEQHTARRYHTTVPQQALFMLNSPFVTEQARHIAARAASGEPTRTEARVERLYRLIVGREPKPHEIDLAKQFLAERRSQSAKGNSDNHAPSRAWHYGFARLDPEAGKVENFEPFRVFTGDAWQQASLLPAPKAGQANLTAEGGAPGDDLSRAVVRRWVSPIEGTVNIRGTLKHGMSAIAKRFNYSNGIRGWVVSDRRGILGTWTLLGYEVETAIKGLDVAEGETIDFVVDSRVDYEADDFSWAPVIEEVVPDAEDAPKPRRWDAAADFRGPEPEPLTPWEAYAQVLLQTNEFVFID